jgi:hypothetical protein
MIAGLYTFKGSRDLSRGLFCQETPSWPAVSISSTVTLRYYWKPIWKTEHENGRKRIKMDISRTLDQWRPTSGVLQTV